VFSDGSMQPCTGTSKGNHGDHVHGASTAGWTVIVITINEQLKPGPASSTYCRHSCWFSLTVPLILSVITSYRILLISLWLRILRTLKMAIIRHRCPVQPMWTLHIEFKTHLQLKAELLNTKLMSLKLMLK